MPESWKLNGNIVFELFLSDLDEKMTSAAALYSWQQLTHVIFLYAKIPTGIYIIRLYKLDQKENQFYF